MAAGYSEEDILFIEQGITSDTELLDAIKQSATGEIEHLYYFGHGWNDPAGLLQISAGTDDYKQFTTKDIDITLSNRFASNADFHIRACRVGDSSLPQEIADAWQITVYASELSMKFWYQQQHETRQWWFFTWKIWVNVGPGENPSSMETRWQQFAGENGYSEDLRVEMKPYTGRGAFSEPAESAYQQFSPSP